MSFHTRAGEQVDHTCQRAVEYANLNNERVDFNFNGILVTVLPGDDVSDIVDKWWEDMEASAEEYRNSPEGKRAELDRQYRSKEAQRKTDRLMSTLAVACKNIDTLVKWAVELSDAPHIDTEWTPRLVAQIIENAGYERHKHVGQPKEFFDDPQVMKEYIVGQAIDGLYHGLPPHQIIHKFAEDAGL